MCRRSYYAEFFDHSKDYVRKFAAETFAFLIRKLPEAEFEPQIDYMLSFVPQRNYSEDFSDGLGQLLFFIVKGIKGQFNSTMPKIFQIALRRLGASSSNGDLRSTLL
jgi:U3 small nucleolar RNA-associated protein 20